MHATQPPPHNVLDVILNTMPIKWEQIGLYLQKKEIINGLLVVVRYFGGTKLGVGGLIRAYTQAGQIALANFLKNNAVRK